ncbi:MAG: N-acetyl-gamma-glutamyl-phosphate reductase [Coriobacteriales bacterium]|nr:N-acetyl-gamma-glutamyl-phosphate reductase [Coriobacteriales bacterium]
MIDVAVVGAAGYAGIELVRLVLGHPRMRLTLVTSSADAGRRVSDVYPALTGLTDAVFVEPDAAAIASRAQMAFLAVPHTAAMEVVPTLLESSVRVVDLSADFRLTDDAVYESWYETTHTAPELLATAVYGLPELDRSGLEDAKLVAAPGCYPTASILAAAPAFERALAARPSVIVDAKSGVSGAGRSATPTTHFCAVDESLAPYKVAVHRHTPEIGQGLAKAAGGDVAVTFVPHLIPMDRGLLATAYIDVAEGVTAEAAHAAYAERYADEPFVRVHELGRMPATSEVRGTNRAHLGVAVDESSGTLIVACAIDNLVKGAAGQAVQCANAVLGYPETEGLLIPGPVV